MRFPLALIVAFLATPGLSQTTIPNDMIFLGPGASGLGGAFTAVADDPTAMIYNPAGLVTVGPNKRSLSYNAYMTGKYRIENVLFNAAWESEATFTPFFVGTTYRSADITSDWTFAAGAYDRGIYASRTRWKAAGTSDLMINGKPESLTGSYEAVTRQSGSALTVAAAAARNTSAGALGFTVGLRYDRESEQEFSRGSFGPIDVGTSEKVYSRNITNYDRQTKGYGVEVGTGGLWQLADTWKLGAMIGQVTYVHQKGESTVDNHFATTDPEGNSVVTKVGDKYVGDKPIEDQELESEDHPYGRPPLRYRIGVAHQISAATRWSADLIGRGYSRVEDTVNYPGADGALGLETLIWPTIIARFGAYTMWDPANMISVKGYRRADTYIDSLGLSTLAMYKADGWSLGLGAVYQQGRGQTGDGDQTNKDIRLSVTTISASFTSDQ